MKYAIQYTILGAVVGLIAPAGVLLYGLGRGGLPEPLVIFWIMVAGGVLVLGAAGMMIGRREDALADRNAELGVLSQQLKRQTLTDGLTEIPNRRFFDFELARESARARRYRYPLSLVMIDVDRFKLLNDRHGHPVGDQVLKMLARVLDTEKREGDTVCRYGGEEFVAILPQTATAPAEIWAERVRRELEAASVATATGPVSVTASFGVAEMLHESADESADKSADRTDPDLLIEAADAALYESKKLGRNRVTARIPAQRKTASAP